jgi:large conductance mechanosensitive channel
MRGEFMVFLKNYGVIGLAIAVIIGGKANAMVSALVEGLLMPLLGAVLPSGDWREASIVFGDITLTWGPFLAAVIDFVIVAWLIFLFAKKIMKEATVEKK